MESIQPIYQSGKLITSLYAQQNQVRLRWNERSFIIKDEKPNQEVLCISEVTKSAICRVDGVHGGLYQISITKAGLSAR